MKVSLQMQASRARGKQASSQAGESNKQATVTANIPSHSNMNGVNLAISNVASCVFPIKHTNEACSMNLDGSVLRILCRLEAGSQCFLTGTVVGAYLLACLVTCLLACSPARLLPCLHSCLLACFPACLLWLSNMEEVIISRGRC